MKQPKFPFLAHLVTEFGGSRFARCRTLEDAQQTAKGFALPIGFDGREIKIVRRYITDTKNNVLAEVEA